VHFCRLGCLLRDLLALWAGLNCQDALSRSVAGAINDDIVDIVVIFVAQERMWWQHCCVVRSRSSLFQQRAIAGYPGLALLGLILIVHQWRMLKPHAYLSRDAQAGQHDAVQKEEALVMPLHLSCLIHDLPPPPLHKIRGDGSSYQVGKYSKLPLRVILVYNCPPLIRDNRVCAGQRRYGYMGR
jgi:hypothetical protein